MFDLTQDTPQSDCFSSTGLLPSMAVLSRFLRLSVQNLKWSPTTPTAPRYARAEIPNFKSQNPIILGSWSLLFGYSAPNAVRHGWFGLFPFRSPLLWESRLIYSPQLLRCFSSLCDLSDALARSESSDITRMGFPHSDILGS